MKLAIFADKRVGHELADYVIQNFRRDLVLLVTKGENDINRLGNQNRVRTIDINTVDIKEEMNKIEIDLGLLAWWPNIIDGELLKIPNHGFINTHPSLLPNNKGRFPNFWAIIDGSPFGVTIHKVTINIDAGEILAQRQIPYDWTDTGGTLYSKAQNEIVKLFKDNYILFRNLDFSSAIQNDTLTQPRHSRDFENMGKIDLEKTIKIRDFLNLQRAKTFEGYTGLVFEDSGESYQIKVSIEKI